jgi:adenylate cyclase
MGRETKIERRFLVKALPRDWKQKAHSQIDQGYLPVADKDLEIRLRRKDSQHFLTIKAGRGRKRLEEEIEIPKERFKKLWRLTKPARVSKTRYQIPDGGKNIEMDVFKGPHQAEARDTHVRAQAFENLMTHFRNQLAARPFASVREVLRQDCRREANRFQQHSSAKAVDRIFHKLLRGSKSLSVQGNGWQPSAAESNPAIRRERMPTRWF